MIPNRAISKAEVEKHNTWDDCWIIIHGAVVDVTDWHVNHPGGGETLVAKAGKDATLQFKLSHPPYVLQEQFAKWAVGYLEGRSFSRKCRREGFASFLVNCFAKCCTRNSDKWWWFRRWENGHLYLDSDGASAGVVVEEWGLIPL